VKLAELLRRQHDVVARGQAITCGMTMQALRCRIRPDGPWQRVLPGVYLARTGTATPDQRDMAVLLYAGPGSVITGCAAMRRLGITAVHPDDKDAVDVLVPTASKRQSSGFAKVQRTVRMPDQFCVSGQIRFAMAARAVADAACGLTDLREVRAVVASSVQRGWCRVEELSWELGRTGPGSRRVRQVLAEVTDGIRSTTEGDFRDLVAGSGLPMPMFNARLYAGQDLIAVPDAWWPDAGVAAEVDSREWHLSPGDWERTMRRHARMSAHGIIVLHFTPRQIRSEPGDVIRLLRSALAAGGARGPLRMRALPAA
jgi:hypothetical protein